MKYWIILIVLAIVWGFSFILMKKGLTAFTPMEISAIRLTVAGMAFFPIVLWKWKTVAHADYKYLVAVGLAGSGIPSFLFPLAQSHISSSVAGILNSLTPLFTLVLGILFYGTELRAQKLGGVLIGLTGAVLLVLFGKSAGMTGNAWYAMLIVFATTLYALNVNMVKTHLPHLDPVVVSAFALFSVGIPGMVYLLFNGLHEDVFSAQGLVAFFYVLVLGLLGSAGASVLFYYLVKATNALFASMVTYLMPVVALIAGFADGEPITGWHFLGMGMILSGVYIAGRK